MPADPDHVIANLRELAALTSDANGAQRLAFTPTWQKARDWFATKLRGLPVTRHLDAAGNAWVTLPGASPKSLVLGSHLDSVPNGGWLDGALGVVTALEILTALARDHNNRPPFTIRIVDWADEEGARFGRSLFGSSAFAGTHTIAADRNRTDAEGITLASALATCGIDIDRIGEAAQSEARENAAAYLELHIEQGPILERLGLPLAAVLGTKGVERHAITFHGQEAHSGSTPMLDRRDALAAAAGFTLEVRDLAIRINAEHHSEAVATIGSLKTFPGIVTAIPGRVECTLDLRDLNPEILVTLYREAVAASHRIAAEERCTVAWSRIWSIEPIPFHPHLIALCRQSIAETLAAEDVVETLAAEHVAGPVAAEASEEHVPEIGRDFSPGINQTPIDPGFSPRDAPSDGLATSFLIDQIPTLPSGPLHDAAEVARTSIPTTMMFVQSLHGISHNKIEDTHEDHLRLAVQAFDRLTTKTLSWLATQ